MSFTYDRVHRNLFMGSAPACGTSLEPLVSRDVLVLCAQEYQPSGRCWPSLDVLHAPMDDWIPTTRELRIADEASRRVVRALKDGRNVLVTCWQGRNRSGLVTGLSLVRLGAPPDVAIRLIRRARGKDALSNEYFVEILQKARLRTPSLGLRG